MKTCAEIREYNRAYYIAHREEIKSATSAYAKKNKQKIRAAERKRYENNKEKISLYRSEWRKRNREKLNKYYADRRRNNPLYRLQVNVRTRIGIFLKKGIGKKLGSTMVLVGCSWGELMNHLESKFSPGMTWENYGEWHIDHIIPLYEAKNSDDVMRLCNYNNLQPLWALDNLKKNKRLV